MLFNYKVIDGSGRSVAGSIDALNVEVAINGLQRRGLTVSSIFPADEQSFFKRDIAFWRRVGGRDIVILSRQVSTLFEAQISALRVFRLLGAEHENPVLKKTL